MGKRVTTHDIRSMKARGEPIPMITAYDFTSAMLADRAGVPIILIGDSLGQVVLGYDSTIPVSLDDMVRATAAVVRGASRPLIVADLPFMTYQESPEQAMRSAARLMQEAGAQAVKLEGGTPIIAAVRRLCESGVPVMGHLGLTPQSLNQIGGYRVQGKDERSAGRIIDEAIALEEAGAFSLVLELVPAELAAAITARLTIPTIGIGAGPSCDGQVQVWHDLLGLNPDFKPRHARRFADLAPLIQDAVQRYLAEVRERKFPAEAETFHAPAPYLVGATPRAIESNGRTAAPHAPPATWTPDRIRLLREGLRLTQTEMSARVGVAKNNLSAWERGKKHPSLHHQAALDSLAREPRPS
jgi:3-methyl-2-oxobutanoate hydroxymethyltransferase